MWYEQAGAELGRGQLKLELGFTKFKIDLVLSVWVGLFGLIDLIWKIWISPNEKIGIKTFCLVAS